MADKNKCYQVTGTNFLLCISQQYHFKKNRPICLDSSDAHRRTYVRTHRPVRRCRVAYGHPSLL